MQEGVDLLSLLRDIREPAAPAWWPPAPGWWIVAAIVIALIAVITVLIVRRHKAKAAYREAVKSMTNIETGPQSSSEKLSELNALLKRAALSKTSDESVASLHGESWMKFLNKTSGKQKFSDSVLNALAFGQYRRPSDVASINAQDIEYAFKTGKDWLKRNL